MTETEIITPAEINFMAFNREVHTWSIESDAHKLKMTGQYELILKSSNGRFEVSVTLKGCDSQPCIQSAITDMIMQDCLSTLTAPGKYKFDNIIPLGHSTNEMNEFLKNL